MNYSTDEIMEIVKKVLGPTANGVYLDAISVNDGDDPLDWYIYTNLETNEIFDTEEYVLRTGATKIVICPDNKDYVIKIPFTGLYEYDEEEGINKLAGVVSEPNVLEQEIAIYESSSELIKEIILPNIKVGEFNSIPIYIQEKIDRTANEERDKRSQDKKDKMNLAALELIESKYYTNRRFGFCFVSDLRGQYGSLKTIEILRELDRLKDLHGDNYGYMKDDRCVVFDTAGYDDTQWYSGKID